ncbi:fibronectin type III-like domain-contianing protein [Sphingopyxis sp. JAI128]
MPIRSLAAFQRVFLKAGETGHVSFDVDPKVLSMVRRPEATVT